MILLREIPFPFNFSRCSWRLTLLVWHRGGWLFVCAATAALRNIEYSTVSTINHRCAALPPYFYLYPHIILVLFTIHCSFAIWPLYTHILYNWRHMQQRVIWIGAARYTDERNGTLYIRYALAASQLFFYSFTGAHKMKSYDRKCFMMHITC